MNIYFVACYTQCGYNKGIISVMKKPSGFNTIPYSSLTMNVEDYLKWL